MASIPGRILRRTDKVLLFAEGNMESISRMELYVNEILARHRLGFGICDDGEIVISIELIMTKRKLEKF